MADKGKFTVHYFNVAGRGELARQLLAYNKVAFEDHRVANAEWGTMKPNMPLHQLPVLDWTSADGKQKVTIAQSLAIGRFLAQTFGLAGKNPIQAAKADQASESLRELQEFVFPTLFEKDEAKKNELINKIKNDHLPRIFGFLEKQAKENGGKSIAGDSITYADIHLAVALELVHWLQLADMKNYPNLAGIAKTVQESEGIKAYLAKRPKPDM